VSKHKYINYLKFYIFLSIFLNCARNGDKFIKDKKFDSLPKNVILEIIKREDLKVLYETTPLLGVVK
jgi:hypothetical protein